MAKEIPMGARGEAEESVEFRHTLTAHHPDLPPVYSTPDMIPVDGDCGIPCAAPVL
jgi:hypothetical protein